MVVKAGDPCICTMTIHFQGSLCEIGVLQRPLKRAPLSRIWILVLDHTEYCNDIIITFQE